MTAGRADDAALAHAAEALARRIGLRVEGSMRGRVARALRDEAAAAGVAPEDYARSLPAAPSQLQRLIDRVTVQETSFFRDAPHFDVLLRRSLPALAPGVIWSVGCANGQEAWSLAITLEEAGAADWRVLATDVSRDAVARTRAGIYSEREIATLSGARRALFMRRRADGRWEAGPRLRARVQALEHNLVEQAPPVAAQVVFCRNVLIYLDLESTRRALDALRSCLPADGWLFLGASEALAARAAPFAAQPIDGAYVYRPRARPAAQPVAKPAAAIHAKPTPSDPRPLPAAADLAAEGEAHAAAGRFGPAAAAFRRAAYLAPDDPVAHVRLGLALERGPEPKAATSAFRAARAALRRAGAASSELGGWAPSELASLLDAKLDG